MNARQIARALRRERILRDRDNPLDYLSPADIKKRFRFMPETIVELVYLLAPLIEHPTWRSGDLSPMLMILITLRFAATGTLCDLPECGQ